MPIYPRLYAPDFKDGRCPATSWVNAYAVVNRFSGKLVKLVPPDVIFLG